MSKFNNPSAQYYLNNLEPARITFARELRGLTKKALAVSIAKTPSAITQFEQGTLKPDIETFMLLSNQLQMPLSFFSETASSMTKTDIDLCHFRAKRSSSQTSRRQCVRFGDLFIALTRSLEKLGIVFPKENISSFKPKSDTIEGVASDLRSYWGLGKGPIHEFTGLVESNGIFVVPIMQDCTNVDAFSNWFFGRPCIILNFYDHVRPSRIRFDIGHELGHLILHEEETTGNALTEREANRFSGSFLIPKSEFLKECPRRWSFKAFYDFKERWMISIQAALFRAKELGIMSESTYRRAMIDISKQGMRQNEGEKWTCERPTVYTQALEALSDHYSLDDIKDDMNIGLEELIHMLSIVVPNKTITKMLPQPKEYRNNIVKFSHN